MKKANIVISILMIAIAIVIIIIANGYPKAAAYGTGAPGPGLWPICISIVVIFLAILLLIKTLINKEGNKESVVLMSPDHLRVYISMAILIVYFVILKPIGFLLPSFLLLTGFIYWFSKENDPTYVAKKAKTEFGKKLYLVFDVVDGKKQVRPLWVCALISLILTFAIYLIFKLGLNVPMHFGLIAF